jgi:hypothetical protein
VDGVILIQGIGRRVKEIGKTLSKGFKHAMVTGGSCSGDSPRRRLSV